MHDTFSNDNQVLDHVRSRIQHRRGATLVLSVFLMFGLFSFVAFSVDIGYLAQSRAEIQRTADAAAMAGCWELYAGMENGNGYQGSQTAWPQPTWLY